ncbi:hypothetical protein K474DRAFT_1641659 [Panus rudis PR-1116 ss-1]|nr:hypothetical protein K474DRAFT_1641659 [Panus rudis PR-1116 ss-1]
MSVPQKRRRTATAVLAGDFDPRPQRDALTSLLNGVPVYKPVEDKEEARRVKKKEKKEKEREKEKPRDADKPSAKARAGSSSKKTVPAASSSVTVSAPVHANNKRPIAAPRAQASTSSFWQARPAIYIASTQRSVSVTPPPMPSSPPTTPGPSISSSTSATSSKRPLTPHDDLDSTRGRSESADVQDSAPKQRKKRVAARKGWKGWVEGSPPPSEKLINLDIVPIIPGERRTRSGKSFDAIGVGKDSWV